MFCVIKPQTLARLQDRIFRISRSFATQSGFKAPNEETLQSAQQTEWLNALPYKEIPRQSKFDFIRSYLPGGRRFENKSSTEIALILKKELGELFVIPGIFGKSDILMVLNPEDIGKMYRFEGIWPVRGGFETVGYFRSVLKKEFFGETSGIVATKGEIWARQRSAVNPITMQPKNAKLYFNSLIDVNDEFVQRIRDVRDPNTSEVPSNFEEDLIRLTFESITTVALNKQFGLIRRQNENPEALRLLQNVEDFFLFICELEMKPSMWKTFRTPMSNKMIRCQEEILESTSKFVSDTMIELENKNKATLTDENHKEPSVFEKLLKIDKKLAIVITMDMMLAGVHTTGSVLAGLLLTMAKNPQKQDILREEVFKVMPSKNSPLTVEAMKNMPYLRACIKESLRVYPVSVGVFRSAGCDLVLGGYQITKGTKAILNNMMFFDEKYYARPNEFVPERWLRTSNVENGKHPFRFLPFGFGPRMCVGKRIVDIELEVCLTKLIRNFKIEYNYPVQNAFKQYFVNFPAIPLNFKFTDLSV